MGDRKQIAILGGGTVSWAANHLAITAPAYGTTARKIREICEDLIPEMDPVLYLTKMAGGGVVDLETNEDIAKLVDDLTHDNLTKIVFFSVSMVDFNAKLIDDNRLGSDPFQYYNEKHNASKYGDRLQSNRPHAFDFVPVNKVIQEVRKHRKDIFLVGFKQTCGLTEDEQYIEGLNLCKRASCNLVLANDTKTRLNMVITPEEARYHVTTDRDEALRGLVHMAKHRSHLTFTRSTVVAGESVPWDSPLVPESLRKVVDYCIEQGAYKPFNGATVGHFACKLADNVFLTSKRRTNFNDLKDIGLVRVETDGPDTVIAYGSKPSVGGQSQRIIFDNHKEADCVVHFHSPIKEGSEVPQVSQYLVECGSMACGQQTSNGLKQFGNLKAVYLQEHGPNIVFNHEIDPQEVINFIEKNFDLSQKTGGFVSIKQRLERNSVLEDFVGSN